MSCDEQQCKPQACAIQDCLKRRRYDESKCTAAIDALYACCAKFYREQGRDASSVCCPRADLLELKVQQRRERSTDATLVQP